MSVTKGWWFVMQPAGGGAANRYLVGSYATAPYFDVYDFESGSPVKLSPPGTTPAGASRDVSFRGDSDLFAWAGLGSFGSGTLRYYAVSGTTVTQSASFNNGGGGHFVACDWSPSDGYCLVGSSAAYNGSTVQLFDASSYISAWGSVGAVIGIAGIRFSAAGDYVAVGATIYNWDAGAPTVAHDLSSLVSGTIRQIAWHPTDESIVAFSTDASPYLFVITGIGGTPAKKGDPVTLPGGAGAGLAWSSDGSEILILHQNTPWNKAYDATGASLSLVGNLSVEPTDSNPAPVCVALSATGLWAMGSGDSGGVHLRVYDSDTRAQQATDTGGVELLQVAWGGSL